MPASFAIPMGLAGLAGAWSAIVPVAARWASVAASIYLAGGLAWVLVAAAYAAEGRGPIAADRRDPVLAQP